MRFFPLLFAAPLALFGSISSAQALTTYNLSYQTLSGSGSLQGTLTIDETDPLAQVVSSSGIPAFVKSLSLTETSGSSSANYTLADFDAIIWEPKSSGNIVFTGNLVPQFNDLNFSSPSPVPDACEPFTLCLVAGYYELFGALPQAPAPVPAPLPLFGAAAAYGTSRRLRRRLISRG